MNLSHPYQQEEDVESVLHRLVVGDVVEIQQQQEEAVDIALKYDNTYSAYDSFPSSKSQKRKREKTL